MATATADDRAARRVLLLAPFPPRLDARHGGGRAVARLVTALAVRHRVALAFLRGADEPPVDPAVASACARVVEGRRAGVAASSVRPWPRALAVLPRLALGDPLWVAARRDARFARAVRALAREWRPAVVQAEFTAMAPYAMTGGSDAVRVVTVHEPGAPTSHAHAAETGGWRRAFWRADARRWTRFEQRMLVQADAAVVFSDEDRRALAHLDVATPIHRIPLAVPLPVAVLDPAAEQPRHLLFVGSFGHPPNVEAALHLARDLWPRLRAAEPRLTLTLVGDAPPAALQRLAGDGLEVPGWVPALEPQIARAAVIVAPLRAGGGMRVKTAEALAHGKAVVGTPLAFAGLDVTPGVHAAVVGDDDAFVAAVLALVRDDARRRAMGEAARALALATLGPDVTARAYGALYDALLDARER